MKQGMDEKKTRMRTIRSLRSMAVASMIAGIVFTLHLGPVLGAEQVVSENTDKASEIPEDEFGRGSPRSAVKGYLAACSKDDYEKAANYLDLRRIPDDGPTLARHLRTVLSRTLWFDTEVLSQDQEGKKNDGLPPVRDRLGTIDTKEGEVEILLQRVPREDGVKIWKIASVSVAQVPKLYEEFGYGILERFLPAFFFDIQVLNIVLWQWVYLLVLVPFAAVVSWLLTVVVVRTLGLLVVRTMSLVDDRLRVQVAGPIRLVIAVLIFRIGLLPIGLDLEVMGGFSAMLSAFFIVAIAWALIRVTDVLSKEVEERLVKQGQGTAISLVPPGRKFVKAIIAVFAFVAILSNFGFNVATLLAGLGVGGIAVALAAQKTIENLFGGIILYADRPVRVGDFCRFGDKLGTVEEIGIRSTRIRTLDRSVITVPNATFSNMEIDNITMREKILLFTVITVRYETPPDQMRYILVEIRKLLYAHERILPDSPRVRFVNFGAYSLDIEVLAYVNTTDWAEFLGIREDIYLRILDIIESSGTGFAFPSQTLYLGKDDGLEPKRIQEVSTEVQHWRERNEVYLPNFTDKAIEELKGTLPYPAEGSPEYKAKNS